MKYTQKLVKWFITCSVTMVMAASLHAETSQVTAKIVRIKGSARYSTGGNVWQNLKVGTQLRQGAIIQTAADSVVDVVLSEGNDTGPVAKSNAGGIPVAEGADYRPTSQRDIIRIYEDTVLAFDRLTVTKTGADKVTDSELDLRAGSLIGDVKKVSPASIFEIKIPNGVAGIRGTQFGVSALGLLGVKTGAMGVAFKTGNGSPKAETIQSGFQYDIRTEMMSPMPEAFFKKFEFLPHFYAPDFFNHIRFPGNNNNCYVSPGTGLTDTTPPAPPQNPD